MSARARSLFEVADHVEIAGRGAFVVGHIRDGLFRVGMQVRTSENASTLTIAAVEYLDRATEQKFWNALAFHERPTLGFLKQVFPVGSVLEAQDRAS